MPLIHTKKINITIPDMGDFWVHFRCASTERKVQYKGDVAKIQAEKRSKNPSLTEEAALEIASAEQGVIFITEHVDDVIEVIDGESVPAQFQMPGSGEMVTWAEAGDDRPRLVYQYFGSLFYHVLEPILSDADDVTLGKSAPRLNLGR